ncbi:MAG TPA: TlpA family protein disulfide reductase [Saprospiraceae bacterium]|nr:TlpA family protein disulfide reductase [Saprospiraceae bacterium]HMQ84744.1 TlpA family protein disulfide reductase [Saprospiraceae bacterium]
MQQFTKLYLLVSLILFVACQPGATSNAQESETNAQSQDTIPKAAIPLLADFADFEPLLHRQSDTLYVVNFWATWCKPCVEELPYFEQITQDFAGEKVKVVLVSLDFPNQIESKLIPFVEKNNLQSEVVVLLDGRYNDWIDKVSPEWSGAIPATLIYRQNQRQFAGSKFASYEELKSLITSLL